MAILTWMGKETNIVTGPVTITDIPRKSVYLDYYFTRDTGDLDKHLINVINWATESIDIAIYFITKTNIVDAIISAYSRGVKIRVIADKKMVNSPGKLNS